MKNRNTTINLLCLGLFCLFSFRNDAQKNIRTFVFGHSLINHEWEVTPPTPSQETSVPHWFYLLAEEAGHEYALSGQYGFLPQHANLPPIAQWGFDIVPWAWDSENEPFSAADFTNILLTPANFIQWQAPDLDYPTDPITPIEATSKVFDWCTQQEEGLQFYIYENWPDMAPYLSNNFPPSRNEWLDYNEYLNGEFHDWFVAYHDAVIANHPDACVSMIPVGLIISKLLLKAPFDQIPIEALYEDDAPHGRPTIYFLAALITYMAMYEEPAPSTYQLNNFIHPIIIENYSTAVEFIWEELNAFVDEEGKSKVFCNAVTSNTEQLTSVNDAIKLSPNPALDFIQIDGEIEKGELLLIDALGHVHLRRIIPQISTFTLDIQGLPNGIYFVQIRDEQQRNILNEKLLKMN
ncbi:MAG: T9SS type A sorting domain-containing protein [Bacteroidota bacterium]